MTGPLDDPSVELVTHPGLEETVGLTIRSFDEFYRSQRPGLVRALALSLGDPGLAAEAVDEAMARAYQRWAQVGVMESPGGWVFRVALNWSRSVLRRHRRHDSLWELPERPVSAHQMGEPTLLAAIASLPIDQRAVVVCRFFLGWDEAQTAQRLDIRPGTAKSRLHRALARLRVDVSHLDPHLDAQQEMPS